MLHKNINYEKVKVIVRDGKQINRCQNNLHSTLKSQTVPKGSRYFSHKPLAAPLTVVHFGFIPLSVLLPVLGLASVTCQCKFSYVFTFTCIFTM